MRADNRSKPEENSQIIITEQRKLLFDFSFGAAGCSNVESLLSYTEVEQSRFCNRKIRGKRIRYMEPVQSQRQKETKNQLIIRE